MRERPQYSDFPNQFKAFLSFFEELNLDAKSLALLVRLLGLKAKPLELKVN